MVQYCAYATSSSHALDSEANAILMRQDVHFLFDKRHLSIVPKSAGVDDDPVCCMTVMHVWEGSSEAYRRYHNKCL